MAASKRSFYQITGQASRHQFNGQFEIAFWKLTDPGANAIKDVTDPNVFDIALIGAVQQVERH